MTAPLGFTLSVHQNPYLWLEHREMHAVITVSAHHLELTGGARPTPEPDVRPIAEVIIVDCSGSMSAPPTKITAAKRATEAAIDVLPDGVRFAIVKGTGAAVPVYPADKVLCIADERTRAEAKRAVHRLDAYGSTAIGAWLRYARQLMDPYPSAVRHALLLTDGENVDETPAELAATLDDCAGHFVCDARGIGDAWDAEELLRITSVLRGAAKAITDVSDLAADFVGAIGAAVKKLVPELRLRIGTAPHARLRSIRQVFPTMTDLADATAAIGPRTAEFSTGSWAAGDVRDYHLCLEIDRGDSPLFEDLRVARVDLLMEDREQTGAVPVLVNWTEDKAASSIVDPHPDVKHYTSWEQQFQRATAAGYRAYKQGDLLTAKDEWGRAVAWATTNNDDWALALMEHVVEIVDGGTGQVRVRDDISPMWLEALAVETTHSTRVPDTGSSSPGVAADGRGKICTDCGRRAPAGAQYCEKCGIPLGHAPVPGGME
jgi:Ca-activated chloride channel family protein